MQFNKPVLTISQQISQLKNRGLQINDEARAEHFLLNISYYRLAGYWWPLQSDKINHIFKPGSQFETVVDLYNFDRAFRLLLFDAIERIEIGFRTRLIYQLSLGYGPWWFENATLFKNQQHFVDMLKLIDNELLHSREVFIQEHKFKYTSPQRPPAWKTIETLSFGHLSKLYSNLLNSITEKDEIAKSLDVPNAHFLESWLQAISLLRNLCAHHSRVWNKNLPKPPRLPNRLPKAWLNQLPDGVNKVYAPLCCIRYMLGTIHPNTGFTQHLQDLFTHYPTVDSSALGFPNTWNQEPLWQ
jgi:abortive infection bacteriophage resistance protein